MNTKQVLLYSADKDLIAITKISALTLTKLNCQVTLDVTEDKKELMERSKADNLHLILIDYDKDIKKSLDLLREIRIEPNSKSKKIIVLYSEPVEKEKIFESGCDSIMSKEEFKRVVNNILVF